MLGDNSPFFLGVKQNYADSQIWYTERPLGNNSIGEFLTKSRKLLPSSINGRKIANHSARKACNLYNSSPPRQQKNSRNRYLFLDRDDVQ